MAHTILTATALLLPLLNVQAATGFSVLHDLKSGEGTTFNSLVALNETLLAGVVEGGGTLPNGATGAGSVFVMNTDGNGFRPLHVFAGADGSGPFGGLAWEGTTLYGTTYAGGSGFGGTIFRINIDGTGFSVLHHFPASPAPNNLPAGSLVLINNTLYGTVTGGNNTGVDAFGGVFKISTDGTNFADLHTFNFAEGEWPVCDLQVDGNELFGTTFLGGAGSPGNLYSTPGTVFKMRVDGTGFAVVHKLAGGANGAGPSGAVVLTSDAIYGTTRDGGVGDNGTVFKASRNGSGAVVLHSFLGRLTEDSDGADPAGGVIAIGDVLFGTTNPVGGSHGNGTLFKINMDGTGYAVLHEFESRTEGGGPRALVHVGAVLYGATTYGGSANGGTLFKLDLNPTANSQTVSTQMNAAVEISLTGTNIPQLNPRSVLVTGPMHGTLSGTLPNVVYTPALDFRGRDHFTFQTVNDVASSVAATVDIDVKGSAPLTTLANLSTRAYCGTGDNVAIGGFVISGAAPKRVLIRAVGPSLIAQGISASEVLADPALELHVGATVIASNDNWTESADQAASIAVGAAVGAAPLTAGDAKSAVLMPTLSPGVYTFIVHGKNGTSGITLLEVYDADLSNSGSTLVNIASRVYTATGSAVSIGGFVISGNSPKQILMRAVGPTLVTQGIAAAAVLQNPTIELHDALAGNAVIATNDDWLQNSNTEAVIAAAARVGAFPFSSTDHESSALLLTLPPGVYTFVVNGKAGGSGIALVETYDAD